MEKENFDWRKFLEEQPPGLTIYDMRIQVAGMPHITELRNALVKQGKLGPHATQLNVDILYNTGKPWPDEMTLEEVREVLDTTDEKLNVVINLGGDKRVRSPKTLEPV